MGSIHKSEKIKTDNVLNDENDQQYKIQKLESQQEMSMPRAS